MLCRQGKPDFDIEDVELKDTGEYIGAQVANSALGWIVVTLFLGLTLTPFCYPLFWQLVYQYLPAVLGSIIGFPLLQAIAVFLIQKRAIGPDAIKNRKYDYYISHDY